MRPLRIIEIASRNLKFRQPSPAERHAKARFRYYGRALTYTDASRPAYNSPTRGRRMRSYLARASGLEPRVCSRPLLFPVIVRALGVFRDNPRTVAHGGSLAAAISHGGSLGIERWAPLAEICGGLRGCAADGRFRQTG